MPDCDRDTVHAAFDSPHWRTSSDAIFTATGISLSVMDFESEELIATTGRCGFCHLATGLAAPGPTNCFDEVPRADKEARVNCRAGLTTIIRPVTYDGRIVAHVVLSGYVASTRERRRLYELLLARGIREESARLALKAMPVVGRRQMEAYADLATVAAESAVTAECTKRPSLPPVDDITAIVAVGRRALAAADSDVSALTDLLRDALRIASADSGALYTPRRDGTLEIIATAGGWPHPLGTRVPRANSLAGKAFSTRRSMLASGETRDPSRAYVALPVATQDRVLGVLEVAVRNEVLPLPKERTARLERFIRFMAATLDRAAQHAERERMLAAEAHVNELGAALGPRTDLDSIAREVCAALERSLEFDVGGLVVTSYGVDRADIVVRTDVTEDDIDQLVSEAAGRDVEREAIAHVRTIPRGGDVSVGEAREGWSTLAVELDGADLTVGYLFVASADSTFDATDRALLERLGAHAATALERAALFRRIRDDYAKTIAALSATLDASEQAPTGHASRVMEYAMLIGEELGLDISDIEQLRFAGLLHDIGTTGVPHDILLKPSKLSGDELERMRAHAEMGAGIVEQIEFLKGLTPTILHHHERWDGKGYPMGLAGEAIPLLARILAVADSFDSMTTERSYRRKMTFGQARRELEAGAGTQYDPRVVAALLEALDREALAGGTGLLIQRSKADRPDLPA